ncbi:MAG: Holliday junction resolvase RuvX [Pseudomonadota bacterium]
MLRPDTPEHVTDSNSIRAMAFDFGLRQIGVAVGNTALGTSQALPILSAKDGIPNWDLVSALLGEWKPDQVLVGDPINMDGTVSEIATRARKFARRLEGRFGVSVTLVDERLTSFAAKQAQRDLGHDGNYKREPVDSLAAELILRDWFNQRD